MSRRIVVPLETRPETGPRKVLVPLDGSTLAESVLDSSLLVGEIELFLLRVVPFQVTPRWDYVPESDPQTAKAFADTEGEAEAYLAEVSERVLAWAPRVHRHVVVDGHADKAIRDYAAEQGIDLIAMATHGRGGFKRAILGSVAEKVLETSSVPVLLLPARAAKRAEAGFAEAAAM